jgi:hypothetical protein
LTSAIIDTGSNCTVFGGIVKPGTLIRIGHHRYKIRYPRTMSWVRIVASYSEAKLPVPMLIIGTDILAESVIDLRRNLLTLR